MNRDTPPGRMDSVTRRSLMAGAGVTLVVGTVATRLYQLQVVEADAYRTLAEDNQFNYRVAPPRRGLIVDRFGAPLASVRDNLRVLVTPEQATNLPEVLESLSQILNLTEQDRARILRQAARRQPFTPILVAEDLAWETFSAVNVRAPDLPGVSPDVTEVREYDYGPAFGHVVGYVGAPDEDRMGDDPVFRQPGFKVGKSGVEAAFDNTLRGEAGAVKVEVNARGRVIRELAGGGVPPTAGETVRLTLDAELQTFVTRRLEGQSAAVVALDVKTGDVLTLVSAPAFDPNVFSVSISHDEWRRLNEDPLRPLHDKALAGQFPPGSTFKMIVALAAMREGIIAPDEKITCRGKRRFGGRDFFCWKDEGHGPVDMATAIAQSCDVYFYHVAEQLGPEKIKAVAADYGFGTTTGIEIAGEKAGLLPDDAWKRRALGEPWYRGESLNLGIGQGYLLSTPIQLAVMTARLASGLRVRPRLLTETGVAADGEVWDALPDSPEALALVRAAMGDVVNAPHGTAFRSRIREGRLDMAGKTGTSQVRRITREERQQGVLENDELPRALRDHALFVAYAPVLDPAYALSVVIEHGGGGARAAAPVARDIMAEILRRDPSNWLPPSIDTPAL